MPHCFQFFLTNICLPSYHKVRQNQERAKRTVHPPHPHPRKELKAAAPPLPVLRKDQDQVPSLPRHQGKAQGLDPRDHDQDQKEENLPVCISIWFIVYLFTFISSYTLVYLSSLFTCISSPSFIA